MKEMNYEMEEKDQFSEDEVNKQVAKNTKDMIKELFSPGAFTPLTRLVIFNTIYFNEKWKFPFEEKKTVNKDFLNKPTKFMFWDGKNDLKMAPRYESQLDKPIFDGKTYIQLEFKGNNGQKGDLITFISGNLFQHRFNSSTMDQSNYDFSKIGLSQIKKVFDEKRGPKNKNPNKRMWGVAPVDFGMPKFKYDYELKIKDILMNQGVTNIFGNNAALDKMFGPSDIYVSSMIHKAAVEVDEAGAKAAAASGMTLSSRSMSYPTLLNQPFKYIIHDRDYEIPYFVGVVRCPATGAKTMSDCLN